VSSHRRRRRREPVPITRMLGRWQRRAADRGDPALIDIQAAWTDAVGEAVARVARPARRSRAGVVTVACADGGWAQTLQARAEEIAERLRQSQPEGAIAGLRFVADESALRDHAAAARSGGPHAGSPVPRASSPEDLQAGERAAAGVEDPVLHDLIARAASRAPRRGEPPKSPS